ncbi:MAG TPA: ABC transporter permease subunit [Actinomycetota bacterium]|jgi:ABC-type transport system involved in multi-copper enzyme maturation permease subunit|nr:ABC transporter permease subunit [Actinomycetota bacterium]
MTGSYRAELLKLSKRATTWVLLGVSLALTELFAYILPYTSYATSGENFATEGTTRQQVLASTLPDQLVPNALGGFPVFTGALALIFGALAVGSEYGWGSLKTILTQRPSRLRVFGGKLLALATMLLAAVLILLAVGALSSSLIAAVESKPLDFPAPLDLAEGIAGGWLILAVWCLFGALLGFVFRSVALPVGLGVVWILAIENLISGVADSLLTGLRPLRDLLPATNAGSLVWTLTTQAGDPGDVAPGVTDAVTGTRASITLVLYLALFVAAGASLLRRQDVA